MNDNTSKIKYSVKAIYDGNQFNIEYVNKETFVGSKVLSLSDKEIMEKLKCIKQLYDNNYISGIDYINAKRVLLDSLVGM